MQKQNRHGIQPTLKSVLKQFKYWRTHRKHRAAIPEKLWKAAVNLTKEHSINQIAKRLKISYAALRERADKFFSAEIDSNKKVKSKFIELTPFDKILPETGKKYDIEIEDNRGWKIKFHGNEIRETLQAAKDIWEFCR